MKRTAFLPILLGLSAFALAQIEPPKIPQPDLTGLEPVTVSRIVDGDTLVVGNVGAERKIRLLGVDAPESNQPHGRAATRFLARLLEGERVFVVVDPKNETGMYPTCYSLGGCGRVGRATRDLADHRRIGYSSIMGNWLDDYNPTAETRAKLGKMNDEWAEIDKRLAAEPTPDERDTMLGRIDEIEYEIDEAVRKGQRSVENR